ncbi:MAG: leucine--tRNA ligase [Candidatus Yanofskybacteria bacterium]|nr:leucine--tRNA ligase [Candidatus Yanofskybacteria bacterium]
MGSYNPKEIEQKWQQIWEEKCMYRAEDGSPKPKLYVLDMFPYPSGDGLHVGHVEGYAATDIYSRYMRMKGYNVLHPMGWDAFGLPAENYAIKTGIHPKETTEKATRTFCKQIKSLGLSYDWDREIGTHTPEYYAWTQWFFLLLYKNGLAYKAKASVNWCESCKTVLANEQVVQGRCERCKSEVIQKELEQWFFKITDFTEDLVKDLDAVDWPDSTKLNQRNWIGKSEGALLKFPVSNSQFSIEVFTTRPDTLFGATYMVLSPEHAVIANLKSQVSNWEEVAGYIEATKKRTELERTKEAKEKTGVELKGIKAVNPATQEEIPVFIADYVLSHYGTGAIMAVPAHDERDFEFAKKYNLPAKQVICGNYPEPTCPVLENSYTGPGHLVGSGQFDGMASEEAKQKIAEFAGGVMKTTYKLRDWLISRQRYWGAPIPVVYDPEGNPHAVPEEHLPWMLPTDVEFKPTGTSPLAESKELAERTERIFGKGWKPEVDTMDTFVCSSWYYFRFADPRNEKEFASKETIRQWLPVDVYMGGAEHTVLHLMYARFFTKVLRKFGYVNFSEPFLMLRHQGLILAEDGRKMSKSLGNIISPDTIVNQYGADSLRLYEMFMGPLAYPKPWNTKSIAGVRRFLEKVWRARERVGESGDSGLDLILHQTIKKVGEDIERFDFNTAISQLMICVNAMEKAKAVSRESFEMFLKGTAPFAPHITEELWSELGNKESIHLQGWPAYSEELVKEKTIRLPIQVNGKVRDVLEVSPETSEEEARNLALASEKVRKWTEGKEVKQVIVVPGKLVNIVF